MTVLSRRPAQNESTAAKPPMTRAARRAPAPTYPRITAPTSAKRPPVAKRAESRKFESLRVRSGGEARGALGEKRARVEHAVTPKLAFRDHRDARLENIRKGPRVLDRHRCGAVLLGERHAQPAIAILNVALDDSCHSHVADASVRAKLAHCQGVLGGPACTGDQV